jgi:hypothetical protein
MLLRLSHDVTALQLKLMLSVLLTAWDAANTQIAASKEQSRESGSTS